MSFCRRAFSHVNPTSMLNLEIVIASDKESLSYIESLYLDSFPPDERRPFEQIVAMLREDSVFVLRLLCDDGRRVGFISCWQWPDLAYVEHFAVDPAVRGGGYGAAALQRLCAEAGTPIVLEVEKPHDEMSRRRIGFYRRCGFVLSERPYVQPPYSEGARPLPLHLMFFAAPSAGSDVVPDSFFRGVRDRLHHDVYRVEVGRYV